MTKDLLPRERVDSVESVARRLAWAMNDLLSWDAPHPRAGTHLFRESAEMETVWRRHGGDPARMPSVDFAHHMVVALFEDEGEYTTARSIKRVVAAEGVLWIVTGTFSRPWPFQNPCSVIRIERMPGEPRFVAADSSEAAQLPE
jgi:hypothetical protein